MGCKSNCSPSSNDLLPLQRWAQKQVKFLQLPTTDIFETPDQSKLIAGLKFINNFLEDSEKIPELGKTSEDVNHPKGTVYIHCKAGRTRSATLVGCYLIMVSCGSLGREEGSGNQFVLFSSRNTI